MTTTSLSDHLKLKLVRKVQVAHFHDYHNPKVTEYRSFASVSVLLAQPENFGRVVLIQVLAELLMVCFQW